MNAKCKKLTEIDMANIHKIHQKQVQNLETFLTNFYNINASNVANSTGTSY